MKRSFYQHCWVKLFLVALTTTYCTACGPSQRDIQRAQSEGQVIVQAIENYIQANGSAPSKLNDLVPQYLPKFPDAPKGFIYWHYWPPDNSNASYWLKIDSENYAIEMSYLPATQSWRVLREEF